MANSRMPKGGIIPKDTLKEVISDLYEESEGKKRAKELEKYYNMVEIYDDCRYCGEITEFFLHDNGATEQKIGNRRYILSHCQNCNRVNWIAFKVKAEGDILHGFVYEPGVLVRREEDVLKMQPGEQEMPSPVPEKKPNFTNVIKVRIG